MKILIVDDEKTTIKLFRYFFAFLHIDEACIDEAYNGQWAVDMCKDNKYDLVFLDMNMPIMGGVEAYGHIQTLLPHSVCIAMSANRDTATINNIIKAGFDDYLIKPFNAQLVKQRLANYLKLVDSKSITNVSYVNLFHMPCFDHINVFRITRESSLAIFWEFMIKLHIGDCKFGNNCTINLAVQAIYNVSTILLKMNKSHMIYIEQTEDTYYFTMTGIRYLNNAILTEIVHKQLSKSEFAKMHMKFSYNKLSIEARILSKMPEALQMAGFFDDDEKTQEINNFEDANKYIDTKESSTIQVNTKEACSIELKQEQILQVYDFIDSDDLIELNDTLSDLESTLSVLQYSALSPVEVNNIADYIQRISALLGGANETYDIAVVMRSLSQDIKDNVSMFIEKSRAMAGLFMAFSSDLKDWKNALFVNGAPNPDYMAATIIANSSTISNIVKPQEASDSDIDDIFGF